MYNSTTLRLEICYIFRSLVIFYIFFSEQNQNVSTNNFHIEQNKNKGIKYLFLKNECAIKDFALYNVSICNKSFFFNKRLSYFFSLYFYFLDFYSIYLLLFFSYFDFCR